MMRKTCLGSGLLWIAVLLTVAEPGCLLLQHPKSVSVLVRDAETKQPINGAEVKLMCLSARTAKHPPETTGATGNDGVVRLAAAQDVETAFVQGGGKGYITEEANLPAAIIVNAKPLKRGETGPPDFVLDVYAEPAIKVELVVPNGYRGLVKVEVETQPDAPWTPGQRNLRCEVPPSGVVHLKGPPLLRHLRSWDYSAHYADGTPLPEPKGMLEVGLRWLKCEVYDQYFVVGTQADWNGVRHQQGMPSPESRPAEGGNGGGGRGHRHRGGGD
jgi:hypothetical protein